MGGRPQPVLDAHRRGLRRPRRQDGAGARLTSDTGGYSGTPLPRKLGIAEGGTFAIVSGPGHVDELLEPLPAGARRIEDARAADVVVLFTTTRGDLERRIEELGAAIAPDRMLWVAWPKRASKVPTDVTEDVVREVALPLGLVDTKVAAVDATWSGLRLVWRREHRSIPPPRG